MTIVQITHNPIAAVRQQYYKSWPVDNYQHRITATLGFDTCSFDLKGSVDELEDFFYNGLTRRVTRYSDDGNLVCWDGHVIEMTLTQPGSQETISLREMFNRISVRYIPIDTTTNPPTESAETSTTAVNDAVSQGKYGVKQTVVRPAHVDRMTATAAAEYGTVLLEQYKEPRRKGNINTANSEPKLSIQCEGYAHTLGWAIYNQTGSSGQSANEVVIDAILASSPAGQYIASRDTTGTTGRSSQNYYNRDDTALDIIQQIAARGDSDDNRWLCAVYENRKAVFAGAYDINNNVVDYMRRNSDTRQEVRDLSGQIIKPWELRPNKWIKTVDLYGWKPTPLTHPEDYQSKYIESVSWSESDNISIEGSPGDKLQVLVARLAYQGDKML